MKGESNLVSDLKRSVLSSHAPAVGWHRVADQVVCRCHHVVKGRHGYPQTILAFTAHSRLEGALFELEAEESDRGGCKEGSGR